jgi:hypothetical protein
MTDEMMALTALCEKTPDADLLNEMIGFAANRLMALETEALCNAGRHEWSAERTNYRNGCRPRTWETRAGAVELKIPKLRKGSYFFAVFLEHRRTSERALIAVIQEAYVHGISTRSVDDLVNAMGMTGISKSEVSRLCAEIDERVQAFLDRPLEGDWPYLWLDATYVKVRKGGRIVSAAVIIAMVINAQGRRARHHRIRHGSAAFHGLSPRMPHSTRPTTRQRRKPKASSASAFPNRSTKSPARKREQKKRWFRTGCEGRISVAKRRHGLNRCRTRARPECSAGSASASSPTISSTSAAPWKSSPLHRSSRSQPTTQSNIPPAIPAGCCFGPARLTTRPKTSILRRKVAKEASREPSTHSILKLRLQRHITNAPNKSLASNNRHGEYRVR